MSTNQFDDLSKSLAAGRGRRGFLKLLGAGAAVVGLGVLGASSAAAARPQCIGNQTPCGPSVCCERATACCSKSTGSRTSYFCCPNGTVCQEGHCRSI